VCNDDANQGGDPEDVGGEIEQEALSIIAGTKCEALTQNQAQAGTICSDDHIWMIIAK
jgi:hypothetical protein